MEIIATWAGTDDAKGEFPISAGDAITVTGVSAGAEVAVVHYDDNGMVTLLDRKTLGE